MSDFSYLDKLQVNDNVIIDFELDDIPGEPILKISPASEGNKPYFNAVLKGSMSRIKQIKGRKINTKMIESNRNEDRVLFAKHVIKGWEGIKDSKGKLAEFNQDNCLSFLKALPDFIFDKVRNFAADPVNFCEHQVDIEEIAKN